MKTPKGQTKPKNVVTTVHLRSDVWEAAKVRAIQERRTFRDIYTQALEEYLARRAS